MQKFINLLRNSSLSDFHLLSSLFSHLKSEFTLSILRLLKSICSLSMAKPVIIKGEGEVTGFPHQMRLALTSFTFSFTYVFRHDSLEGSCRVHKAYPYLTDCFMESPQICVSRGNNVEMAPKYTGCQIVSQNIHMKTTTTHL